jgi:tetratricopeptide (TPR) repeat protein
MQDNSESHAVTLLTRAVEADRLAGERGRNPEIVFYLAYAHGRKGRRADAVELLKEVLRIDPTTVGLRFKNGVPCSGRHPHPGCCRHRRRSG